MPDATSAIRSSLTAVLPLVPGAVQVTLTRTNPDTGAVITVATDVWAKRTKKKRSPFAAGSEGGELGQEETQWRLEASGTPFVVHVADRVTDPDGVVWVVTSGVDTAGLGVRWVCQCVRQR